MARMLTSSAPSRRRAPQPLAAVLRRPARGAVLLGVALLAGCSALAPKLETPQLSVVGIEVLEAQVMQQRFLVKMRVQNPNDRELPVRGLSYTMQLAGEDFGEGLSNKAFTVPALGEAEFDMTVTTNLASSLLKILPKVQKNQPLEYRLRGKVNTDWTFFRTIPFDETGELRLK